MRSLVVLAMALVLVMACGGGASSPPIQVAPAVTSAPSAAPDASAMPKSTPGYDYGY